MQEKNLQVNWDQKFLLTIYTLKSCVGTQTLKVFYLQLKLIVAFQCHLWLGTVELRTPSGPRLTWD